MIQLEMFQGATQEMVQTKVNEWLAQKRLGLDDIRLFYVPTAVNKTSINGITPNERHNIAILYLVKDMYDEPVRVIDEVKIDEVSLTGNGHELGGTILATHEE